jgi:hypothetical protein
VNNYDLNRLLNWSRLMRSTFTRDFEYIFGSLNSKRPWPT